MLGLDALIEKQAAQSAPSTLRLQNYVRSLPTEAQSRLLMELERAQLAGEAMPGADLIREAIASAMREAGRRGERIGNASRLFFTPLEPFLVDEAIEHRVQGHILRPSLAAIWTFLSRDLAPKVMSGYERDCNDALSRNDISRARALASAAQDQLTKPLSDLMERAKADSGLARRLASQLGDEVVFVDLQDVAIVLANRDVLSAIGARLPVQVRNLADDWLANLRAIIDLAAARNPVAFPFVLALAHSRLSNPHQLIRLATLAAESDDPAKISGTPYRLAVDFVLADMERIVRRLKKDVGLRNPARLVLMIKDVHDAARGLRTEMNLSSDTTWSRRLAKMRAAFAQILTTEIEPAPGQVRRLLRARLEKDDRASTLDPMDVEETDSRVQLVCACRNYANEIAMNEVSLRVFTDLQSYLEKTATMLFDSLRSAPDVDRPLKIAQIEAAIRFCSRIFGQSYGQLLQKAADVAIQGSRAVAR